MGGPIAIKGTSEMSTLAIRVEHLSKCYRLGKREKYRTLRESLVQAARSPFRRDRTKEARKQLWALDNVSFQLERGEVLGIIGRNGAGKSTLLKVLSRITEPTTGRIEIFGKIGSLLEVGTGFHAELTGRENIFLNGAILGMGRLEIERQFDAIVSFAGVETFIDTPVKHYSSGMYLRLAFAVAAHLQPDILIVDEVLAVGDANFQRKCISKMGEVAAGGRTVLFVSHSMPAVLSLCSRVILLEQGHAIFDGRPEDSVNRYLKSMQEMTACQLRDRKDRQGSGALRFTSYDVLSARSDVVRTGDTVVLRIGYEAQGGITLADVNINIAVYDHLDCPLFHLSTDTVNATFSRLPQSGYIECAVRSMPLLPGTYHLNLFCTVKRELADGIQHAGTLTVEPGDFFGTGRLPLPRYGCIAVAHSWSEAGLQDCIGGVASRARALKL
jgi:lipopolysaccharide transport system ATP-binding protein